MSVGPPGAKATISFTGRVGHEVSAAVAVVRLAASKARAKSKYFFIHILPAPCVARVTRRSGKNAGTNVPQTHTPDFAPGRSARGLIRATSPHELIPEPVAVRLDPARGRMGEMDRQHEGVGARGIGEEAPARALRLLGVPIEDRRPARLAALERVMHEVADHDRVLPARADV